MTITRDSVTRSQAPFPPLDAQRRRTLIVAIADSVILHADELSTLDAAIGDGDHGHNMKRGFEAVPQDLNALSAMDLPDLLKAVGTKLVMKVGGASGPLYGTLFLALGKALPVEPSRDDVAAAFASAIAAVRARGKSDAGQKTMLDVLMSLSPQAAISLASRKPLRWLRKRRRRIARRAAALHFSASDRLVTSIPARDRLR